MVSLECCSLLGRVSLEKPIQAQDVEYILSGVVLQDYHLQRLVPQDYLQYIKRGADGTHVIQLCRAIDLMLGSYGAKHVSLTSFQHLTGRKHPRHV